MAEGVLIGEARPDPLANSIVVFTPTMQYGGLDVTYAQLCKQTVARRIIWVIGDDRYAERESIYAAMAATEEHPLLAVIAFPPDRRDGYPKTLTSAWNTSLDVADTLGAGLHVSLQDYIWIPDDGVERLERELVKAAYADQPAIIAGLCGIANDPGVDEIANPEGLWTIFEEPWHPDRAPNLDKGWWWKEVRGEGRDGVYDGGPIEWEANWAAAPRLAFGTGPGQLGIRIDPEFDRGISCENQDFSFQCLRAGLKCLVDPDNLAIGLPHKAYFPEVTEANGALVMPNREYMEQKWGLPA